MVFDIDIEINEDELQNAIINQMDELVEEWLENEAGNGHWECDCGSDFFDVKSWRNADGELKAAAVCRECNERMDIEVDMTELEKLRK